MRRAKIQISLRIRTVWSDSSLCAFSIAKAAKCLLANNEDSDQTVRMRRLIWVFVGRTCQRARFLMFRLKYILWVSVIVTASVKRFKWVPTRYIWCKSDKNSDFFHDNHFITEFIKWTIPSLHLVRIAIPNKGLSQKSKQNGKQCRSWQDGSHHELSH